MALRFDKWKQKPRISHRGRDEAKCWLGGKYFPMPENRILKRNTDDWKLPQCAATEAPARGLAVFIKNMKGIIRMKVQPSNEYASI